MQSIKDKIDRLIVREKEDTFFNHPLIFLNFYDWCGNREGNKFRIWKQSHWTGSFYPVIHGEIKQNGNNTRVTLIPRLNIFAKFLTILIIGGLTLPIGFEVFSQPNLTFETFLWRALFFSCLILIPVGFIVFIYRRAMRVEVEELRSQLKTKG